ncbi:MAG: NAD(P)-dependent oxidoreductase [Pseudomonadota bacterium]
MSILITGGTGVIGSMIVRQMADERMDPIVLARREDFSLLEDVKGRFKFVQGDVSDFENVSNIISDYGIRRIIHAGALMPGECLRDPIKGFGVNSIGTLNLLEAARRGRVERFVYTSAKGVYSPATGEFAHPTYKPIDENYPRDDQMGLYGSTKLCGEIMGFQYRKTFGLDFITLRFSMTYGPGKLSRHGPLAVHSKMIENSMLKKSVRIPRGSDQKDDMIYTKDCARATVMSAFHKDLKNHVFNIGTGTGKTLVDFSEAVKKVFPGADVRIGPGLDYLGVDYNTYSVFDVSRAKEELGFSPEFDFEKAVEDYKETLNRLNIRPAYSP